MSMKLHTIPLSPHCRKIMALIGHLDIPCKLVIYGPGASQNPDLLAVNPNGKVPALQDGDVHVWESNEILHYLAAKLGSDLWPKDSAQQREIRQWQFWESAHYSHAVLAIFFQRIIKSVLNLGAPNLSIVEENLGLVARYSNVLDDQLGKHDFIVGGAPTIADFSIGTVVMTTRQSDIDMSAYKNIQAWLERMEKFKGWDESIASQETKLPLVA